MTYEATLPNPIADADLREWIKRDFGARGGGSRLAAEIGVSINTGCVISRSDASVPLVKVAAFYGYRETVKGTYIHAGARCPKPIHVGRRSADIDEHKSAILAAIELHQRMSFAEGYLMPSGYGDI